MCFSLDSFPASQWRTWKLCCLRSTTESPTCAFSKTSYRSEKSAQFILMSLFSTYSSDASLNVLLFAALTEILHVYAGGRGQERSVISQLRTALQNSDVWHPEECECQFWVRTQTHTHIHTQEVLRPFTYIKLVISQWKNAALQVSHAFQVSQ